MSNAWDGSLNEESRFTSDTANANITKAEANDDHFETSQVNQDAGFMREDIHAGYDQEDGPSKSSDRLMAGPFQSMEREVVVVQASKKRGVVWKIVFVLFGLLIGILFSMLWRTAIQTSNSPSPRAIANWKGWGSVEHAFIFGDSWTDTAFDPSKAQPSPANPIGNPDFPGSNSANATNWVGFLTTKYNATFLRTYNLAAGGSTLDNSIVQGYPIPVTSQVYGRFMPHYGDGHHPPWNATNSLFIMFAGVVDLIMMNGIKEANKLAAINGNLTIVYSKLLDSLHGAGARNFLLLGMPPLERCWQPGDNGPNVSKKLGRDGAVYNERIRKAAAGLKHNFKEANVWLFDTEELFNQALDDPQSFPQTSGILNTTTPCMEYQSGTPTTDYFNPKCSIPVNRYFWLNGLHPTYPIHDVMAEYISKLLDSGPNVK